MVKLKADVYSNTTVGAALATKANATDVTTSLATKANTADVTVSLAAKANAADVYTKTAADAFLSGKQDKFTQGSIPASNAVRLFDTGATKFRAVACSIPLSVSTSAGGDAHMTISADVYDKGEVDSSLSNKTDKSTTNNSATAWSSGFASDGYYIVDAVGAQ